MVKRGLKIIAVPADVLAEWRRLAETVYADIRGNIVPAVYFDEVIRLRDEFREAPLAALANQWFAFTGSMTDMKWVPLTGATVISARAWSKIPAELRPKLAEIVEQAGYLGPRRDCHDRRS